MSKPYINQAKKKVLLELFTKIIESFPEMITEIIESGYTDPAYDALYFEIQRLKTNPGSKVSLNASSLLIWLYCEVFVSIFMDDQLSVHNDKKMRLRAPGDMDLYNELLLKAVKNVKALTWDQRFISAKTMMDLDEMVISTDLFPMYCFVFKILKDQDIDLFFFKDPYCIADREIKILKNEREIKKMLKTIGHKNLKEQDLSKTIMSSQSNRTIMAYLHIYGDYPVGYFLTVCPLSTFAS